MQMHQVHTELCIIRKRKNASVHVFVPAMDTVFLYVYQLSMIHSMKMWMIDKLLPHAHPLLIQTLLGYQYKVTFRELFQVRYKAVKV